MTVANLDPATLQSFQNAAAGHEGTLSDPTGTLFIKPCTAHEVSFYETATASHPRLTEFLPSYLGTLQLSSKDDDTKTKTAKDDNDTTLSPSDPGPMHGKHISSDVHIVLANSASPASFTKPNILDVKLGARLWDDAAAPAKRARLDAVAAASTSGSLGFRVAGMRVWKGAEAVVLDGAKSQGEGEAQVPLKQGGEAVAAKEASAVARENGFSTTDEAGFTVFNKLYGRQFNADNASLAFKQFLHVPGAGVERAEAAALAKAFGDGVRQLRDVLLETEVRMYSASILLVYEGDGEALRRKVEGQTAGSAPREAAGDEDDNEDEEEEKVLSVKLIDFAHATFVPGQGPDENLLQGVHSTINILDELVEEYAK